MKTNLILILTIGLLSQLTFAQDVDKSKLDNEYFTLQFVVSDAKGLLIPNAKIEIQNIDKQLVTNRKGKASCRVSFGNYNLHIRIEHGKYRTENFSIAAKDTILQIILRLNDIQLDTVAVFADSIKWQTLTLGKAKGNNKLNFFLPPGHQIIMKFEHDEPIQALKSISYNISDISTDSMFLKVSVCRKYQKEVSTFDYFCSDSQLQSYIIPIVMPNLWQGTMITKDFMIKGFKSFYLIFELYNPSLDSIPITANFKKMKVWNDEILNQPTILVSLNIGLIWLPICQIVKRDY